MKSLISSTSTEKRTLVLTFTIRYLCKAFREGCYSNSESQFSATTTAEMELYRRESDVL